MNHRRCFLKPKDFHSCINQRNNQLIVIFIDQLFIVLRLYFLICCSVVSNSRSFFLFLPPHLEKPSLWADSQFECLSNSACLSDVGWWLIPLPTPPACLIVQKRSRCASRMCVCVHCTEGVFSWDKVFCKWSKRRSLACFNLPDVHSRPECRVFVRVLGVCCSNQSNYRA